MTTLRVRVGNPTYGHRSRYAYRIPQYNDYEGTVIPNPVWVSPDSFCLSTGNPQFPFRIIAKEDIICGWEFPTKNNNSIVVESKGKKYLLTKTATGYSCNCTGYSYRRHCSHIEQGLKIND